MVTLFSDLRHAVRLLSRHRLLAAVSMLSLGVAIGANTAVFSVVHDMFYRWLPVEEAERVVLLYELDRRRSQRQHPVYSDFEKWRRLDVFQQTAVAVDHRLTFVESETTGEAFAFFVSSNFFSLLGVAAEQGRVFVSDEDQQAETAPICVIGHRFWTRRFGGDPHLVGKQLRAGNVYLTVVGILPNAFERVGPAGEADIWLPLRLAGSVAPESYSEAAFREDVFPVRVFARLRKGHNIRQAQALLGPEVELVPLREDLVHPRIQFLVILLASAVGLVLLVACANVSNLLLALASGRQKEMAVRAVCGASRGKLLRQSLTEGIVLALPAGVLGAGIALVGIELLVRFRPDLLFTLRPSINLGVLSFNCVVATSAGVVVALSPAIQVLRHLRQNLADPLKGRPAYGGLTHRFATGGLLNFLLASSQIAISLVLLIASLLTIKSFISLTRVQIISEPDRVLIMPVVLPEDSYPKPEPQKALAYTRALLERVRAIPGVEAVDAAFGIPVLSGNRAVPVWLDDGRSFGVRRADGTRSPEMHRIGPQHFRALGLRLLRGREFSDGDTLLSPPVAIINRMMAREYWPGEESLGRQIRLSPRGPWMEIVGVVTDTHYGPRNPVKPEVYVPFAQAPSGGFYLLVRTTVPPKSLTPAIADAMHGVDPLVPARSPLTAEEAIGRVIFDTRYSSFLLSTLGFIALVLASAGIYSIMSHYVARRIHDFGIRTALGASPVDIWILVMRSAGKIAAAGVAVGLGGAILLTRFVETFLYDVSPTDPSTFVAGALTLAAVALSATIVPARRASQTDPVLALRQD